MTIIVVVVGVGAIIVGTMLLLVVPGIHLFRLNVGRSATRRWQDVGSSPHTPLVPRLACILCRVHELLGLVPQYFQFVRDFYQVAVHFPLGQLLSLEGDSEFGDLVDIVVDVSVVSVVVVIVSAGVGNVERGSGGRLEGLA